MNVQEKHDAVRRLLNEIDREVYDGNASDEDCMGLLVSQYFEAMPRSIAIVASRALEDANAHALAGYLDDWAQGRVPNPPRRT